MRTLDHISPVADRPDEAGDEGFRERGVRALALVLVAGCGLAPAFGGLYRLSLWGPIALIVLALLLALIVARPATPRPAAIAAVLGLAALWLWSLLSISWAESADRAALEASRWLLYLSFFAILVLTVRSDRVARLVLGLAGLVVGLFATYLCLALLLPGSSDLFVGGRLTNPLGYVNGQAGYLLLGFWPLVAVAERSQRRLLAGAALGGAVVLAGLAILTQSRAIVPAIVVSALVVCVAVPGRKKRLWALVLVAVAAVATAAGLLDVYGQTRPGARQPDEGTIRSAVAVLLIASVVAGALWWGARHLFEQALTRRWRPRQLSVASAGGLLALFLALAVVGLAAVGNPVSAIDEQVQAFKRLDVGASQQASSRFTSGGGNRYDYWRVALRQFEADRLKGLGAGNYNQTYFLERRTIEDIRQPHSIELQLLAELGLVGLLALALFVGAVLFGLARRCGGARADPGSAAIAVGAGGTFLFWLVHTSVDWLHLIPGATGLALCAAACLVAPWRESAGPNRRTWLAVALASLVVVLGGVVLVGRATLADHYRTQAEQALDSDPLASLEEVDHSLALNDEALDAYYVKAAAAARLGRYEPARAALLEATRREPREWVTWGLLGDLAVRRGDFEQARTDYGRASRLNPRDSGLKQLAADPRSALRR